MVNLAHLLFLNLALNFNQPEMNIIPLDTIVNWQLYMGRELLFKSHEYEKTLHTAILRKPVEYDSVRFKIFYDWTGGTDDRRIDLIYEGDVVASFAVRNDLHKPFPISKAEIELALQQYPGKALIIKYYDSVGRNGRVVGLIRMDSPRDTP